MYTRVKGVTKTINSLWVIRSSLCEFSKMSIPHSASAVTQTDRSKFTIREYSSDPPSLKHSPTGFDKKILVWTKFYKTIDEVPDQVSLVRMKRARDWFRIRFNLGMGGATIIAAILVIYSGKRAVQRRDLTISQRNIKWHKEINEEGK